MSAWGEHIANVSFTQHFLGIGGDAPDLDDSHYDMLSSGFVHV